MGLTVGFLGLGIMGEAMARNLLTKGDFEGVVVWNRTASKCDALVGEGARAAASPAEVVAHCNITFAMLSDPAAALDVVFGPHGVLQGLSASGAAAGAKGYVDMSTVSPEASAQIGAAVAAAGGRFLEAPVSGSKGPAVAGQLVILAAGDASLYEQALPAFAVMGKRSFLLGGVGAGARMKLVVNGIMGCMMAAFCEGMALADSAGLAQEDLLAVLELSAIANPMFALKGPSIVAGSFPPAFPLKHQQKDLRLALALGEELCQRMPVTAAANELYKGAKAAGCSDDDFAAVYEAVRPVEAAHRAASRPGSTSTLCALGHSPAAAAPPRLPAPGSSASLASAERSASDKMEMQ